MSWCCARANVLGMATLAAGVPGDSSTPLALVADAGDASATRSTGSTAFSHPGMPSRSSRARPMPRACLASGPKAPSRDVPLTCARSNSYWAANCPTSRAAVGTVMGVFFPVVLDTERDAERCCADAPEFRSAVPAATPAPPRLACAAAPAPPWPARRGSAR